jgi:hypothetical protein
VDDARMLSEGSGGEKNERGSESELSHASLDRGCRKRLGEAQNEQGIRSTMTQPIEDPMTIADISASELAVLDTLLPNRIAFLPDVAIVTKLTPSETKEIVTKLTQKRLVENVEPYVVRITDRGEVVAKSGRTRIGHPPLSIKNEDLEAAFQDALKKLAG